MFSQQEMAALKTFGNLLTPGEKLGKTNTERNSEGSDMRLTEAMYTSIYVDWLSSIQLNLFAYSGFPDTFNWHYLEYLLTQLTGYAGVGMNSQKQLVVFDEIAQPSFNEYGEFNANPGRGVWQRLFKHITKDQPQQIFATSPTEGDYAVFVNKYSYNLQSMLDNFDIQVTAKRLANIQSIMHYNLQFQKTPIIMKGPRGALENKNIFSQIMGGETLIEVSQKFDNSQIDTINLNVPIIQAELRDAWNGVLSEWATRRGINTVGVDKKERVTKNEAESNNQITMDSLNATLEPRRYAVQLLNKRFGYKGKVHLNTNAVDTIARAMMTTDNQGKPATDPVTTNGDNINSEVGNND